MTTLPLLAVLALVLVAVAIALRLSRRFQVEHGAAAARLAEQSTIVQTACGPAEYAELGRGLAVLFSHGANGGYDQGLHCLGWMGEMGVRFICPSRFGYLRTPLPSDASPAAQADAHAALLDALNVDKACVIGISAGGMSALQFALRHPGRCWGLALISAISRALSRPTVELLMTEALFSTDFLFWFLGRYSPATSLRQMGVTSHQQARVGAEILAAMHGAAYPPCAALRRAGVVNDLRQAAQLPGLPLGQIAAPTLLLHGTHDPLVPFALGQQAAGLIPDARLVTLEGGGHFAFFTHFDQTRPALLQFFRQHAR